MHRSLTCSLLLLVACAASPAIDAAEDLPHQRVPIRAEDADTPRDDDQVDAEDAENAAIGTGGHDAALPSHADALTSADAAPTAPHDAGRDTTVAKPASAQGSAGLPPPDPSLPRPLACMTAAACTKPCFPVGLVSCCRVDHVCGCTWAPGAYCL